MIGWHEARGLMETIGRVKNLRRYPFKSMRGEELARALVTYSGVAGDRVYALVDPTKPAEFPWFSARQAPELVTFTPRLLEPPEPDLRYPQKRRYKLEVTTPEGGRFDAEDPAFLAALEARFKRKLELRFSEQGMQDDRPLSIFCFPTLTRLENETGVSIDYRQFRANFYIEWNREPFAEDELVGRTLAIGQELIVLVAKKDTRCVIITLDPETAKSTPAVLKTVVQRHEGCAGVYAVTVQEGVAASGDEVKLLA
ncbi:MAG: MOSC domain-containing protein [Elusimicrobia bacterium]|nr:MOSC domain-containing protein [Elusimicrobiota bacterium]